MRTITQITLDLKVAFVSNAELASSYALDQTKTFDEQFSKVSIEALLLYVVAVGFWTIEKIVEAFSAEVDARIEAAYITSLAWYHAAALGYQQGDALTYNPATYKVEYAVADATKQIVKFAAVKEIIPASDAERSRLQIKVSKAAKAALSVDELSEFKNYLQRKGAAGMVYDVSSGAPVSVAFNLEIMRDPLLLKDNASGRATLCDALDVYLNNLDYGGEISTSGVIAALMAVPGVKDLRYNNAVIASAVNDSVRIESATGAFVLDRTNMVSVVPETMLITML